MAGDGRAPAPELSSGAGDGAGHPLRLRGQILTEGAAGAYTEALQGRSIIIKRGESVGAGGESAAAADGRGNLTESALIEGLRCRDRCRAAASQGENCLKNAPLWETAESSGQNGVGLFSGGAAVNTVGRRCLT